MILSCPNCATRYTLSDAQLGVRGRKVRCTACKTTWHAERPEKPIDLTYSDPRKVKKRVEDLQKVKAPLIPAKYRAILADKKRLKAIAAQGMVWGGMATTLAVALTLAFTMRVDIVRTFPRIAGAYAMVGLKTNGTYLQFGGQTADVAFKGGRFVVNVTTKVTNISDKAEAVPPVRVKLQDSTLADFASVLIPSNGLVVPPHATRTLSFDVADPKNMTTNLVLDFDLEAMKRMKSEASHVASNDHPVAAGSEDAPGHEAVPAAGHTPEASPTDAAHDGAVSDHPLPTLRPALSAAAPDEKSHSPEHNAPEPAHDTHTGH